MTQQAGDPTLQPGVTPNPVTPDAAAQAAAAAAAAEAAAKAKSDATPTTLDDKSPAGSTPALDKDGKPVPAVPATPDSPAPVTYEKTGDVGLDMALAFVGKLGIDSDHEAMKKAGDGDFTMLKALIAAMPKAKTQGWEQMLELGESSLKGVQAKNAERATKDKAAIFKAAGGEDNWKEVQAWANQHAEESERADINAALKGGGTMAKAMASWLASTHASWKSSQPRDGARPTKTDPAGEKIVASTGPLSPEQFRTARNALIAQRGTSYLDGDPEYTALTNRRRAWRG